MRVRIIRHKTTSAGVDVRRFRIGRIYDLDASVASLLLVEGCAEIAEGTEAFDRREHASPDRLWQAADLSRTRRKRSDPSESPADE